ncbi:Haloacid dehalogenase-like hydrolase domain-containing protein 3 [Camellia lanceoleosa]|uniref:Haloacid dehalogenase-like hydrolase domain-containing protein 3 n=1 Tax=Camellia lanceoleosa TaxID=1840588 RepID=A0ACC0FQ68_9ERIC|nr:Haloacid dehalogenase-like hydrolase domain-containing protein 3 [Camellia lanceoleosa]
MALIPTTKSKISNLLSILTATHKTPSLASASYSNGAARKFRVAPFGGSGRSLSSSVAPLESDMVSLKDYEEYRKALYGGITHKALLVDAVGTLVLPSQPMAQIYRQIGEKYGVQYSETEILNRYRRAYEQPWGRSRLRYVNDGRPFWQYIVSSSTGCSDSQYFEELYNYYTTEKVSFEALIGYNYFGVIECICSPRGIKSEAWHLCDPDAEKVFKTLRNAGVKLAVVSNFDTRLRPVLRALNCDYWFDAVAVSAEVAAEKPNPTIFIKACELLGVKPEDAVHVGDDRRNDIWGARDAGCDAWLWGSDVHSFKENMEELGRWSNIRYG